MGNPWSFGWTQLLTIIGFIITTTIAIGGFRTFERWKREKLEEKRIDTAIEALALAYESKFIFDHIRSEMSFGYEWQDMPVQHESEERRNARGPFYAMLKRIEMNKEYFDRAWKLQVRCTAIFGPEVEETFLLLQKARREVEVSAGMLYRNPEPDFKSSDNLETWNSFRADVWPAYGKLAKADFKDRLEKLCRPVIDREYGTKSGGRSRRVFADLLRRRAG
jgi:hypothetical protein